MTPESRKSAFPSEGYARKLVQLRKKVLSAHPSEFHEAQDEYDRTMTEVQSVQRLMWPIRFASHVLGTATLIVFISVVWYGYGLFLQPFGPPELRWVDVLIGLLTLKYAIKGLASVKLYREEREEATRLESMLWLDRVKEEVSLSIRNLGAAFAVALVFYVFSFIV